MREIVARDKTLPDAYHRALFMLYTQGVIVRDNAHNTNCKECAMTLVVEEPLREPRISGCVPCGPDDLEQYRLEMLEGIMDFCIGNGWNYTYHDRMTAWRGHWDVDQIRFVLNELSRNPTSRRAVIDVRNNIEDVYSDDPACLQHVQYFIRGGKLDCDVLFRSNDAVEATFMNAFALICLQECIAKELGVEVGTYTHRANSFHAYEKNWDLLKSYARRWLMADNPTYYYEGNWKEQMEEARPTILRKVEKLHERMVE